MIETPVMYHSWHDLTFLHWKVDREKLQALVPPGLMIETYEDEAYVGLVPFTMSGIRLAVAPRFPGFHSSHETNVRTYVVDEQGRRGVWFFSLDAANAAFVRVARAWYRLPYYRSTMSLQKADGEIEYRSKRFITGDVCRVDTRHAQESTTAQPGTLDEFLVERYNLFAYARGRLLVGRVVHLPYPLAVAECRNVEEDLVKAAQIMRPDDAPLVHFSPGVDVEVFPMRRA